jgi:MFS transporter, DHA1 family, tetracycline resistance protein
MVFKLYMNIKKNPLLVTFLTVFIDLLGFGILIPVLPVLLTVKTFGRFENPSYILDQSTSNETGYILLGLLLSVYALGQFLATPILGQLSDKFGRRPILALSLFGTSLSYVIFAYAIYTKNLELMFISRFFDGITGGNISVAQAVIADISDHKSRAKNFGLIGAAFGLGFILGPFLGGKLSDPTIISWFNAATPFVFAAVISFINMCGVLVLLPETNKFMSKDKSIVWSQSFSNIAQAIKLKDIRTQLFTSFLFQSGFTFFTSFAGTFFYEKFALSQSNVGDLYAFIGFWIALVQAVVTRKLSKKYSESQVLRFSYFGASLSMLGFLIVPKLNGSDNWLLNSVFLFSVVPVFALFIGLIQANSNALISKSVEPHKQGQILGINASVQALAQFIPSVLSGFIAAGSIFASSGQESIIKPSGYPLLISMIMILMAGVFFLSKYKVKDELKKQTL